MLTMRYSLRSLMIAAAVGPPLVAVTWFALRINWSIDWSDEVVLAVAIACAIPYGLGIGILVAMNHRRPSAWIIGVAAVIIWPVLFFMSLTQLALVIPVWSVLFTHGSDLGKPLSPKTILLALGLTGVFIFWIAAVAMIHG